MPMDFVRRPSMGAHKKQLQEWWLAGALMLAALAAGCQDATGPRTGSIRLSLTTSGLDVDPDGYSVSVDDRLNATVRANGAITIPDIRGGTHVVRLGGVAANCSVDDAAERTLTVTAGQEVSAAFAVSCTGAGGIAVSIAWTGVDIDAEEYLVSVDDGTARPLGLGGAVTIAGLAAGDHTVRLTGVASNCTVGGANPKTVTVVFGQTAFMSFPVTCVAGVGGFRVTAVTTGSEIDPDGYTVVVMTTGEESEVISSQEIGANASVTFAGLRVGTYTAYLTGVAPNCTVAEPAQPSIRVRADGTADLTFTMRCLATGSLRVTNATSGPDADPDGYAVHIQGGRFSGQVGLATGGAATVPSLLVGSYSAVLEGLAENCDPVGPDTVRVEVVAQTTATIALDVACTPVTRLAFVSERDGNAEIYAVNSNGTSLTRLTNSAARDLDPAWSTDSRRIAFTSDRSGAPEIWLMDANGSNVVRRTSTGAPNSHPAWSPDGARLAFVSMRDGNAEIYTMAADDDGAAPVRLTTNDGLDSDPAWSPDGRRIAFASDRNGAVDIYVMNADGSGVTRLT